MLTDREKLEKIRLDPTSGPEAKHSEIYTTQYMLTLHIRQFTKHYGVQPINFATRNMHSQVIREPAVADISHQLATVKLDPAPNRRQCQDLLADLLQAETSYQRLWLRF